MNDIETNDFSPENHDSSLKRYGIAANNQIVLYHIEYS